jgi:hypothetical protein
MSYQQFGQQFGHVDPEERLDYAEPPPGEEDEYLPPRRWPMMFIVAGVMVVFAGAVGFAYYAGTRHATVAGAPATSAGSPASVPAPDTPANVPLIRADTDPVKVRPEKAGGMNIPDKDDPLYAMKPGQSPAEHILPPPEAPQPRPVAPPPPAPPPQQMAQTVAPPGAFPAPLPAPPQVGSRPAAAPKAADAEKPAAAAGPPMKIQLASLRSPDEARDEWQRVKHENGDLLGKYTAVAVRSDLGDRGIWYRVEVGPVGDKAAALKLCKALKERDLGCQLVP